MHETRYINISGWRGGIGVAFSQPAARMADITELGIDIVWGCQDKNQDIRWARFLKQAVYRYFGCTIQGCLKDPEGRYDFSHIKDKNEAACLAFDKYAELTYGRKGMSRYVKVWHQPTSYGDFEGIYDLSSQNPLIRAVVRHYLKKLIADRLEYGGIALDNAGKIPEFFLAYVRRYLGTRGYGIATNGSPEKLYRHINFFCNEKFPFSVSFARSMRYRGFKGAFGEFPIRHLNAAQLEQYLKAKLLNRIVWFGYTDDCGCNAASVCYSFYHSRPDVYDHHRWVLRRIIPLSRTLLRAKPIRRSVAMTQSGTRHITDPGIAHVHIDRTGRVIEGGDASDRQEDIFKGTTQMDGSVDQYGSDLRNGVYFFVNSNQPETVIIRPQRWHADSRLLVWDEFGRRLLPETSTQQNWAVRTDAGPSLLQLGSPRVIVKNILSRVTELFKTQLRQRRMDHLLGCGYPRRIALFPDDILYDSDEEGLLNPLKPWEPFCQGYLIDTKVRRSGRASLKLTGGRYHLFAGQVQLHYRQGAAQLVNVDQSEPTPLELTVYSRAENVSGSNLLCITDRRKHFQERLGLHYCAHFYLDYQDGEWPEIHTAAFSPGTHDWERRVITVRPKKPVKTAMVLLEFHQPQGTAWFDDVALRDLSRPRLNLLACAGFEADDIEHAARSDGEYERRVRELLAIIAQSRRKPDAPRIQDMILHVRRTRQWLKQHCLDRVWSREWRDLTDAERQLNDCWIITPGKFAERKKP